jgi:hypothetical protein
VAVGAALGFMALAGWLSEPWWEHAFRSDGSPVAWLSSALLVANGAVAFKLALDGSLPRRLGSLLAAALGLAALDEQFLLHERFQYFSSTLRLAEDPRWRWIGELPTLVVGLAGIALVWAFTRAVRQQPARRLMLAALAVGLIALWVDLGSAPHWLRRVEEGVEVVAETLFLCALLEVAPAQVQSSSAS